MSVEQQPRDEKTCQTLHCQKDATEVFSFEGARADMYLCQECAQEYHSLRLGGGR